jgi:hypothetical protein
MAADGALDTKSFFTNLSVDTIDLIDQFYDPEAHFEDPLGQHHGVTLIKQYYHHLYKQVISIEFDFDDHVISSDGQTETLIWTMHLVSGLKQGQPLDLNGASHLRRGGAENRVVYHRDYFDMGEFVYEHIPVLKSLVHFVKRKMTQKQ